MIVVRIENSHSIEDAAIHHIIYKLCVVTFILSCVAATPERIYVVRTLVIITAATAEVIPNV
jgi:hypothetical protein